jgi:hypothetical protein
MILNELTMDDALEAVREETWEKAQKETREKTQKETREEDLKQVLALIDKGLTSEQLKQTLQRDRLRVVPQTTKTKSSKR